MMMNPVSLSPVISDRQAPMKDVLLPLTEDASVEGGALFAWLLSDQGERPALDVSLEAAAVSGGEDTDLFSNIGDVQGQAGVLAALQSLMALLSQQSERVESGETADQNLSERIEQVTARLDEMLGDGATLDSEQAVSAMDQSTLQTVLTQLEEALQRLSPLDMEDDTGMVSLGARTEMNQSAELGEPLTAVISGAESAEQTGAAKVAAGEDATARAPTPRQVLNQLMMQLRAVSEQAHQAESSHVEAEGVEETESMSGRIEGRGLTSAGQQDALTLTPEQRKSLLRAVQSIMTQFRQMASRQDVHAVAKVGDGAALVKEAVSAEGNMDMPAHPWLQNGGGTPPVVAWSVAQQVESGAWRQTIMSVRNPEAGMVQQVVTPEQPPEQEGEAYAGSTRQEGQALFRATRQDGTLTLPLRHPQWGEQLAQRMMVLAQHGQQLAQIRLHPAHLGPIQVKLKMEADSGVQVSLHAHHALTREAIEQAVPRLRELFQQQGLILSDVTVQPDARGHAQAFADARREQGGQAQYGSAGQEAAMTETASPVTSETRRMSASAYLVDHFV